MPGHLVLLRFLLASTALALYAGVTRMRLPARRDLPGLAVLGVVGVSVCQIALNMGEQTVTAGTASFLIVLVPVFTALLATVVLDERLTAIGWLGIALAMGGTAVLIVGQGQGLHATAGAGLVLIAAIAEAIYFVRQKSCLRRYSGLELATYTLWAATGGMLVFTPGLFHQLRVAPRRPPSQWSTWPSTQRPWAT
jgi:drug/metabolite transporter (DMT)-like permease